MDLRRHLLILRSSAWIIAVLVTAAAAMAFAASALLPRAYEARATLYVGQSLNDPSLGYDAILASQFLAQTYTQLATTGPILARVIDELGLETTPQALALRVTSEVPSQGTILSIIARGDDPEEAALIANAVARQVQSLAPSAESGATSTATERIGRIDAIIAATQKRLLDLVLVPERNPDEQAELSAAEAQLSTLNAARNALAGNLPGTSPNTLTLVDQAVAPTSPIAPSRTIIVGIAAALALAVAVALAYIRDAWRSGSRTDLGAQQEIDAAELPARSRGGSNPPKEFTTSAGRRNAGRSTHQ